MNKLLIALCLALTVAACASTPSSPRLVAAPATTTDNCAPINPSAPQSNCVNQNGSVYTQQQWQTQGATTTSQALRSVSPQAH